MRTLGNVILVGIFIVGVVLLSLAVYDILGMFDIGADGS